MSENSSIEWTHHTFNPWRGCTKATFQDKDGKTQLHPGCLNCYAEVDMSVKLHGIRWGKGQERVQKAESGWREPLSWARKAAKAGERHRVFCASLADVLDDEAPRGVQARLWDTIRQTAAFFGPRTRCADVSGHVHHSECRKAGPACGLDWLLLTKRPENWRTIPEDVCPLAWLGTSISEQTTADEWVPRLRASEGFRYRFLSVEPLVGPVNLSEWIERIDHCNYCEAQNDPQVEDRCPSCGRGGTLISTWGRAEAERYRSGERYTTADGQRDVAGTNGIDWVIVGGESGPKARPCNVEWVRSIVRQCADAGVPCFVKQMGSALATLTGAMTVNEDGEVVPDKKGGDMKNWPEDLRVRQFPEGR